jgi:hypothetical protein
MGKKGQKRPPSS